MEKILIENTFLGVIALTWICIILGSIIYMLDKYLEQSQKNKASGKHYNFGIYILSPETWIPLFISIIIIYFLALGAGEYIGIMKQADPRVASAMWGLFSYVGYSHLRKRVLGNKYLKSTKP